MEYAMALGGLADRNREQRHPGAQRDLDPILGGQALGLADGGGRGGNVGEQEVDLAPVDPAALVDHVASDLHRGIVLGAVLGRRPGHGLQHADTDRLLGVAGCGRSEQGNRSDRERRRSERNWHGPLLLCQ
jgi:hypothetical protein